MRVNYLKCRNIGVHKIWYFCHNPVIMYYLQVFNLAVAHSSYINNIVHIHQKYWQLFCLAILCSIAKLNVPPMILIITMFT